jgi:hypothetical protein
MSDKETGGPAFPTNDVCYNGMTLRDYFAAQAMQGFLNNPQNVKVGMNAMNAAEDTAPEWISAGAYAIADAMLKARGQ